MELMYEQGQKGLKVNIEVKVLKISVNRDKGSIWMLKWY